MFSGITRHFEAPKNELYRERDRLLQRGEKILDLVTGNVTAHGFCYPQEPLQTALSRAASKAKVYRPDPFGQPAARRAVSSFYGDEGISVPYQQIVLTPGTSISYWYAFKILADPGEEVLCPNPCYPLFDTIAALCGIRLIPYALRAARRWELDFQNLESIITDKTRAIVLISPHNPTGAVASETEIRTLAKIAARRNLPIISDEVFGPFLFNVDTLPRPSRSQAPLVLTLNGLSKMYALPGMKIGWIAVTGKPPLVKKTLTALEMISDTFLPVNEIAQLAVPEILRKGKGFLQSYRAGIRARRALALDLLSKKNGVSLIPPEGGFYLTLRLGDTEEEEVALTLLRRHRALVHPGYFYDLEGNHLVLSFVSEPAKLKRILPKLEFR